jgi:hypothetical protein
MAKVKFKTARMGFPAGSVVDESAIKEGVLKTLWAFGVLEKVKDDRKLDSDTDDKSVKPASNRGSSKKSSKPKS